MKFLTLFLPAVVTWPSYMGWFRPWPVWIGLNVEEFSTDASVHYFFINGMSLNYKKTFKINTTNMVYMHAYMSTLGPSKYKYEWCQRILLVAASSPSSHNILNQPAALPGAFPEVLLQLWRPPPHCGWFCLKSSKI